MPPPTRSAPAEMAAGTSRPNVTAATAPKARTSAWPAANPTAVRIARRSRRSPDESTDNAAIAIRWSAPSPCRKPRDSAETASVRKDIALDYKIVRVARVLVVEDSADIAELIKHYLDRAGHDTT